VDKHQIAPRYESPAIVWVCLNQTQPTAAASTYCFAASRFLACCGLSQTSESLTASRQAAKSRLLT
jgi:hypothetical protein